MAWTGEHSQAMDMTVTSRGKVWAKPKGDQAWARGARPVCPEPQNREERLQRVMLLPICVFMLARLCDLDSFRSP